MYDLYDEAANSGAILAGPAYTWNMKQTFHYVIHTTSQEFKLDSPQLGFVRVLAGVYFDHDITDFDFVRASYTTGGAGPPPFSGYRVPDTKTYAAYTRAESTLLPDQLTLITGLRVTVTISHTATVCATLLRRPPDRAVYPHRLPRRNDYCGRCDAALRIQPGCHDLRELYAWL